MKPSRAWNAATTLDLPGRGNYNSSGAYAAAASKALARNGVPNELVTFHYTVADRDNNSHILTRSAVLYRDDSRTDCPWWLLDNMVRFPVWLPNGSVAAQIQFVTRYEPEIVSVQPTALEEAASKPCFSNDARMTRFYKDNGTVFNPESSMDRQKMTELECLDK